MHLHDKQAGSINKSLVNVGDMIGSTSLLLRGTAIPDTFPERQKLPWKYGTAIRVSSVRSSRM
jgi:hypothetical protein